MELDASAAIAVFAGLAAVVTSIGAAKLAPAAIAVGMKWIKATIFS